MTKPEIHDACALAVADAETDIKLYAITEAHHIARVFVEKARARGVYDNHYSTWAKYRKKIAVLSRYETLGAAGSAAP